MSDGSSSTLGADAGGVQRHRSRRGRPRPRPDRDVPALARRRGRGRPARAERDGALHGLRRRAAVVADGAAQGARRVGLRVLHQPALAQGRWSWPANPRVLAALPVAPARAPGARRRGRVPAPPRGRRDVLRQPPARRAARCLGLPPVLQARRPRRSSRRRTPRPRRGSPTASTSPCRRSGAATASGPTRVEFWQGRRDRLHDRLVYRRDEDADGWVVERLAP